MSTVKATNFQHASATNPAIVLAADGSATANVSSINNGPLAGMRNRIINGDMRIDQRNGGASFTSSGLFYCLDRWLLQAVGATNTAQQVTGSTGNNKAVRITGNTGNTLTGFSQKIESWNILDLAAQTVTLSFTLSGSSAGAVSVRRLYPTAADNYTATTEPAAGTSINFTTTPTRYTLSFTLDANANKGFWLFFDFGGVGSGVTRTLEDVQLEPGTVATPFERRPIGTELALCQRYYIQNAHASPWRKYVVNVHREYVPVLPVSRMRTAPTVTKTTSTPCSSLGTDQVHRGFIDHGVGELIFSSLLVATTVACKLGLPGVLGCADGFHRLRLHPRAVICQPADEHARH
jgi:hypothetical protein